MTAAAALAAVGAGVTASPAAAATGDLATGGQATAVLAAGPTHSATLAVAATPVPFGQLAVPTGHAAPEPHQVPSQAPRQPVAKVRVAAAADSRGASGQQGKPGAQQPTAQSSPAAQPVQHPAPPPAPAPPPKPYLIYDSVTPQAIPPHRIVATYATGGYAVPAAQVAGRSVVWIDTRGTDPAASALDVEPGDATPSVAASWAWHKLSASPGAVARIYTMISEWPAVKSAIASLPQRMQSHIRYWIADPTGVPHVVPGANATQWYWGKSYDISTANPGF